MNVRQGENAAQRNSQPDGAGDFRTPGFEEKLP